MKDLMGPSITLRVLQHHFFDDYLSMFSPLIQQIIHVPDIQCERTYLEQRLEKMNLKKTFFFCIFNNDTQQLVGGLEIRDRAEHPGQLYSWINERFWGKGLYQEAIALLMSYYFSQVSAAYVTAHVDISNVRSFHALKKCGFANLGYYKGPYGLQYALVRINNKNVLSTLLA